MLISFLIPSRNTFFLKRFFDHLETNTLNKKEIEVLVKLDDDIDYSNFIKESKLNYTFHIEYLISPRLEGQPSLWFAVEQLYKLCNVNSYFIQILSDEPYIITKDWDKILESYKDFFSDGVFRLRTSNLKYFNYSNEFDCVTKPDSYPIYTRKWLDLTLGIGDCWGSDAYQQLISYYLSLGPLNYLNFFQRGGAISRDIPIEGIKYSGLEWGVGVNGEKLIYIRKYMLIEWNRLISKKNLENVSYKSMRIFLYILAKSVNLKKFSIIRNGNCVELIDEKKKLCVLIVYFGLFPKFFSNYQGLFLKIKNNYDNLKTNLYLQTGLKFFQKLNIYLYQIIGLKFVKMIPFFKIKKFKFNFFSKNFINNQELEFLKNVYKENKTDIFPTFPNLSYIMKISNFFQKRKFNISFNPPGFQFLGYERNIKIPIEIKTINQNEVNYARKQLKIIQIYKKTLEEKLYE